MSRGSVDELTPGEIELLIGGLSDDISFLWALIHLGLRPNPAVENVPPHVDMIDTAFMHFGRLVDRNLVKVGRVAYVDPNQPRGSVAPVEHISEPIDTVRERVEDACSTAADWSDWAFSCWLVTTDDGDAFARQVLQERT